MLADGAAGMFVRVLLQSHGKGDQAGDLRGSRLLTWTTFPPLSQLSFIRVRVGYCRAHLSHSGEGRRRPHAPLAPPPRDLRPSPSSSNV